jgi:Gpi18-like mannosyltransferase
MHWLKKIDSPSNITVFIITNFWLISLFLLTQLIVCQSGHRSCFDITTLSNWDGQHFLQIASRGYLYPYQLAFFPLYPFLIKLFGFLLPLPLYIVGVLLNIIFTLMGINFLFRLLKNNFSAKKSLQIIFLIVCFPLSFFFLTVYSESLFFCLSVLVIYFYQKKHYWKTVILLSLLVLTRMAGLALVGALLLDLYNKKALNQRFLIPFFGIALFAWYGYFRTGELFSVVYAETHWERLITAPGFAIYNSISILFREGISYKNYSLASDLVLVVAVLILLIKSAKFLPRLYFYYALLSLLIPLSTSTFLSLPRFVLVIFPLFIAFYSWSTTMVRVIYCLVGIVLSIVFFATFLQGGWIS